jgi:uncharacterized membrane protein (UPF0127 family)
MRVVTISNVTRSNIVGDRITIADTSMSRLFGLLGKRGLNAGEGLWIEPSSGVHTFGMMFSIDVIGLDKDLRVTRIWHRIAPFRVTSVSLKIRSVIELGAGAIQAAQIQIGDQLRIAE